MWTINGTRNLRQIPEFVKNSSHNISLQFFENSNEGKFVEVAKMFGERVTNINRVYSESKFSYDVNSNLNNVRYISLCTKGRQRYKVNVPWLSTIFMNSYSVLQTLDLSNVKLDFMYDIDNGMVLQNMKFIKITSGVIPKQFFLTSMPNLCELTLKLCDIPFDLKELGLGFSMVKKLLIYECTGNVVALVLEILKRSSNKLNSVTLHSISQPMPEEFFKLRFLSMKELILQGLQLPEKISNVDTSFSSIQDFGVYMCQGIATLNTLLDCCPNVDIVQNHL